MPTDERTAAPPGPDDRRAPVEPLDVDGVRTIQVGTALWALAFLLLLPFYDRLSAQGHLWWLWTCAAGFGLGCLGWDHCRRRRRARRSQRPAGHTRRLRTPRGRRG